MDSSADNKCDLSIAVGMTYEALGGYKFSTVVYKTTLTHKISFMHYGKCYC